MTAETPSAPIAPQIGLARSILLHLLPGALITLFYFLVGPAIIRAGYPPIAALMLAIVVILIPLELGILFYLGRKRNRRWSLAGIVLYREPVRGWKGSLLVLALLTWGALCFVLLSPVEGGLASSLFSWMPDWSLPATGADQFAGFSQPALLVTLLAGLVLNGIAGPIVEELYFRGYLLPRLSRFGAFGSAAINVVLFSLYHFFSPWGNPTRVLALLPLVYVVARKRSIGLSIWVHCLLNTVSMLLSLAVVLGGG